MYKQIHILIVTCLVVVSIISSYTEILSAKNHSHAHKEHKGSHKDKSKKHPYAQMMDSMMDKMHIAEKEDVRCIYTNFLSSMIPHHEGAITMAEYEIKHGKNPEMIALAKQIIEEQKKEIQQMKEMLKDYKVCPQGEEVTPAYQEAMANTMKPMMADFPTKELEKEKNPDRAFALAMIPHHQGAIDMARVLLTSSKTVGVVTLSKSIIESQEKEITQMKEYLKKTK